MIVVRDDAGAGLLGAIDGTNRLYTTTHDMRLDRPVDVYVNGSCRMASLDNGYDLVDTRNFRLKEALLPGDTLSVRYICTAAEPGVEGGQPPPPVVIGTWVDTPTVANLDCLCSSR